MQIQDIELTSTTRQLSNQEVHKEIVYIRSNRMKALLTLVFVINQFVDSNAIVNITLISILALNAIRDRFLSDTILFLLALVFAILQMYELLPISMIQLSVGMTFYSFEYSKQLVKESLSVWTGIKNLVITMVFVILICAYLGTGYYRDQEDVEVFYSTFGRSVVTLVQALTLDDWGQIGRTSDDLFGYLYLCLYILLMTYFYMNIMMGLLLDTLKNSQEPHQVDPFNYESNQEQLLKEIIEFSLIDKILLGDYYQLIVFILSFGSVLLTIVNNFEKSENKIEELISMSDDIIYTIHFILLFFLKGKIYALERQSKVMMLLHFLAGPFSLILNICSFNVGCLFNLLKVATTPSVKGIFRGTLNIIPSLLPQFTQLLGIIMLLAAFLVSNYSFVTGPKKQIYFSSFWGSVYSLVQIMTLDDWSNIIEPVYEKHGLLLPYLIVPIYIIISNFIILNTLIALSTEFFVEIRFDKVVFDKSAIRKSEYTTIETLQKYCQQNKLRFRIPCVSIGDNDPVHEKLKQNDIIQIQSKGVKYVVQIKQQSDAL